MAINQVKKHFRVVADPLDSGLGRDTHLHYGHPVILLHALGAVATALVRLQSHVILAELLVQGE